MTIATTAVSNIINTDNLNVDSSLQISGNLENLINNNGIDISQDVINSTSIQDMHLLSSLTDITNQEKLLKTQIAEIQQNAFNKKGKMNATALLSLQNNLGAYSNTTALTAKVVNSITKSVDTLTKMQ